MKVFVATIIAQMFDSPLAKCREIDVADIDGEEFSLEEEEAIRELTIPNNLLPGSKELASSLAEGALGVGKTEEEAKMIATAEWCRQEANAIEWKE